MSFNFPTAPQVNRQQALLAGGGAVVILAALGWFFFLRPANEAPAADTPAVSAAARARAAREAAIKKRQAAGGAPVAQAGDKAPANAKDSAAAKLAAKGAAPKAGAAKKDSAALRTASAAPGTAPVTPAGAAKPASRDSAAAAKGAPAEKDSSIVVMREDYAFEPAGRRDPFVSLVGTEDIGPVVADLTLTGILWHPTRPVAVLRQLSGQKQQYRVTIGSTLGRMRVTQIKPKTVIFTIEEFGFNRRDSLILGDTTQVRAR